MFLHSNQILYYFSGLGTGDGYLSSGTVNIQSGVSSSGRGGVIQISVGKGGSGRGGFVNVNAGESALATGGNIVMVRNYTVVILMKY